MNPKVNRHSVATVNRAIEEKGCSDIIGAVSVNPENGTAVLKDIDYGDYTVDLKCLAPSGRLVLHKRRKHRNKIQAEKLTTIGQKINEHCTVIDVFYGPDRGYKNRSFFYEYKGTCGHICVATKATIVRHKKSFQCSSCACTVHGERGKSDGVLKQRTPTYLYWLRSHKSLPPQYADFCVFRDTFGDRPSTKSKLVLVDGKYLWVDRTDSTDRDMNLMASSLRQSFRHSSLYKKAMAAAAVETEEGTRYRCASCKELFTSNKVQIDHIDPVAPIDGTPLKKEDIIDRVWTDKIQVLDGKCHSRKSAEENRIRRELKKKACKS